MKRKPRQRATKLRPGEETVYIDGFRLDLVDGCKSIKVTSRIAIQMWSPGQAGDPYEALFLYKGTIVFAAIGRSAKLTAALLDRKIRTFKADVHAFRHARGRWREIRG